MTENKDITVAYFVWLPYGIGYFKRFLKSYLLHDAACAHKLVIVFNGMSSEHPDKIEAYKEYLLSQQITTYKFIYFPGGQDIETYKQVAAQADTTFLLILNMFSEILADQWLAFYAANMNEQVGVISATGSRQSYYSSVYQKHSWRWEAAKGFDHNFKKYKLFIKAFFYWRFLFKPYPNPHLRTNAFFVRTSQFLAMNFKYVDSKFKAYQFENGRESMTNYYLRQGLKALLMDKYGKTYEPGEWQNSSTFWINDQENLLVSDNQTGIYRDANDAERKSMTKLAWGIS